MNAMHVKEGNFVDDSVICSIIHEPSNTFFKKSFFGKFKK